jgi:zinc finger SWIM domain-containing protein 3
MTVKLDKTRGVWFVAEFVDEHSHVLATPDEVPFLWSHRRINEYARREILSMGAAGVRKYMIMRQFITRAGGYKDVGFIDKDMYNLCSREKRKMLSNGDASTALGIMKMRKNNDPDFYFDYDVDEEKRLKRMFWCDSQSRRDYQDYGDVLVFDSTYKMNKYRMPFIPFVGVNNHRKTVVFGCAIVSDESEDTYVWLLQTFLKAMCQQMPKSVITDADAAMIRAIRKVLPDVWHRICTFHIERNMAMHLPSKSLEEFRTLLYRATSRATFEVGWSAFIRKWQRKGTQAWLTRMYNKKRLWAAAFLSEGFWLGMKSNQRSESLNSCLHLHLDGDMTLVDMIVHYENAVIRLRVKEARDDCTASQTLPVPITNSRELEVAASKTFTPAVFYILQDELKKIGGIEILERMVGTDSNTFVVAWKENRSSKFYVEYTPNSAEVIRCSCRRMIRKGIPCKHIFHVLKHLNIVDIPDCCVLRRFSKYARLGLPVRRTSDMFGWGWSGAQDRRKFSELNMLSSQAFNIACNDPAEFDLLKETMNGIISRRQASTDTSCSVNPVYEASKVYAPAILDPLKVSTKGRPDDDNQPKGKGKNPKMTKNGRPLSHNEQSKKACGACGKIGHNKRNPNCPMK